MSVNGRISCAPISLLFLSAVFVLAVAPSAAQAEVIKGSTTTTKDGLFTVWSFKNTINGDWGLAYRNVSSRRATFEAKSCKFSWNNGNSWTHVQTGGLDTLNPGATASMWLFVDDNLEDKSRAPSWECSIEGR